MSRYWLVAALIAGGLVSGICNAQEAASEEYEEALEIRGIFDDTFGSPEEALRRYAEQPIESWMRSAMMRHPRILEQRAALEDARIRMREVELEVARDLVGERERLKRTLAEVEEVRRQIVTQDDEHDRPEDLAHFESQLQLLLSRLERALGGPGDAPRARIDKAPFAFTISVESNTSRPKYPDEVNERLRTILDSEVSIVFDDAALTDVLQFISDTCELNFVMDVGFTPPNVTIDLRNVPLADMLGALADQSGNETCFIIRDYGIFVTSRERAVTIPGPSIPADVPYYESKPDRVPAAAPAARARDRFRGDASEPELPELDYIEGRQQDGSPSNRP